MENGSNSTMIGVTDLRTCIQAIVQCSPELVSNMGQDYTVYAYDYSEYQHPLVGQGMLSWALATPPPTSDTSAHDSRKLITGRVCKNIQGLFSNGVAETLEVKLRLVPVQTIPQNDYTNGMEKYREMSKAMPPGFDPNEWFAFLQANPSFPQAGSRVNTPPVPQGMSAQQRPGTSMEIVNQLLSPSLQPQNSADPFNNPYQLEKPGSNSRPNSPGGAVLAKPSSRPASRASVKRPRKPRAPPKPKAQAVGGNTSGYEEGTDGDEAPLAKKRATITKTNWNSKSSFGTGSDSLRVAASTSGSLRLFRPIAIAPNCGPSAGSHLQETPRAPTPVPQLPPNQKQKQSKDQNASRRNSILSKATLPQREYNSPYPPSEAGNESACELPHPSIESAMTSPEKEDSPADTPPDITSSPPRLIRNASQRSTPICPSSPVLPPMPKNNDSGFMSGDMSELFEEPADRPVTEEDPSNAATHDQRRVRPHTYNKLSQFSNFEIHEVTPGPPELLPTKMLPRTKNPPSNPNPAEPKPKKTQRKPMTRVNSTASESGLDRLVAQQNENQGPHPLSRMGSMPPANYAPSPLNGQQQPAELPKPVPQPSQTPAPQPASRTHSRAGSMSGLPMPAVPASEPNYPPSRAALHHANTWSEAPHPRTDAPTDCEDSEQPTKGGRRSAVRKKTGIQSRLEAAILNGEMPPYCANCGAISTPTWRKAWAQEGRGDPGYHEYSDKPGMTTAIEILEKDDAGKPISYRLIKKSLGLTDLKELYSEVLLCNPCGIWMSKYKAMRPEDRWTVGDDFGQVEARARKRATSARAKKGQSVMPTSEANFYSDAPGPQERDDQSMPPNYGTHTLINIVVTDQQAHVYQKQDNRGASVQAAKKDTVMTGAAGTSLQRAIQSSPARFVGTRHSPIDVEDEMGITRRLLFPSPRKDGTPKVLGELATNTVISAVGFGTPSRTKATNAGGKGKNGLSRLNGDEDIVRLFEEDIARQTRPSTPVQDNTPNPFKTPTRKTPNHRPITRSVTRSAQRSARLGHLGRDEMLPQCTPAKTPSTARRSPRHRNNLVESPFTATMNRLLDANSNEFRTPSRNLDLGLHFGMPDLSGDLHSDSLMFGGTGFDGRHQEHRQDTLFSTDMPMQSSPPRLELHGIPERFDLYSDPMHMSVDQLEAMDQSLWDELALVDTDGNGGIQGLGSGLAVDSNGRATFSMGEVVIKVEEEQSHRAQKA